MSNRRALVMTGAVSLGSFQAGVIAEFLYALQRQCEGGADETLDVITGASAGSITAGLVAHVTMNDAAGRDKFHTAWVDRADITNFLKGATDGALLSTQAVRDLAGGLINKPFTSPAPAPYAPPVMRLGLTLANLAGVDRQVPGAVGGSFTCTFFDDVKRFRLKNADEGPDPSAAGATRDVRQEKTWADLIDFAIASGSFPFAFPPVDLDRFGWEYTQPWKPPVPRTYPYVDGGTFNNQPIGEAVGLAREADQDGAPGRTYLFVSAWPDKSLASTDFSAATPFDRVAGRLARAVFAQSRASDYLRSQMLNVRTRIRDNVQKAIGRLIGSNSVADPSQLIGQLEAIAREAILDRQSVPEATRVEPTDTLAKLKAETEARYDANLPPRQVGGKDTRHREVAVLVFLILDQMADLNERRTIDLGIIAPKPDELAGDELGGFGGFFERDWREFNYRTGRLKARAFFRDHYKWDHPPEKEKEHEYDIPKEWKAFPGRGLEATDKKKRAAFLAAATDRIWEMLKKQHLTGGTLTDIAARKVLKEFFRAQLKKRLKL